jgi:hypothetical protein
MKRSKAFVLFGGIVASIAAYSTWCGRTFYLKPQSFSQDTSIPPEVMQTVREWNAAQNVFGPPPFNWEEFLWLLQHPYDSAPPPIRMNLNGGFHDIFHPGICRHPGVIGLCVVENWQTGHQVMIGHIALGDIPAADFNP